MLVPLPEGHYDAVLQTAQVVTIRAIHSACGGEWVVDPARLRWEGQSNPWDPEEPHRCTKCGALAVLPYCYPAVVVTDSSGRHYLLPCLDMTEMEDYYHDLCQQVTTTPRQRSEAIVEALDNG